MSDLERKISRETLDLEQQRIEWLNKICEEAKDKYGFTCLREIIEFMLDHASDIHLKSGDVT